MQIVFSEDNVHEIPAHLMGKYKKKKSSMSSAKR